MGIARTREAGLLVRPLRGVELAAAADRLFEIYRGEPPFATLCGAATGADLDGLRPVFRSITSTCDMLPGGVIGCHRAGRIIGVVCCAPDLATTRALLWSRHPLGLALSWSRYLWHQGRNRPRLRGVIRDRWRTYGALVKAAARDLVATPHINVLALAVERGERRQGVARRLLAVAARAQPWAASARLLQVATWDEHNVAIYRRLGFEVHAHLGRDGVHCWILVRPIRATAPGRLLGAS